MEILEKYTQNLINMQSAIMDYMYEKDDEYIREALSYVKDEDFLVRMLSMLASMVRYNITWTKLICNVLDAMKGIILKYTSRYDKYFDDLDKTLHEERTMKAKINELQKFAKDMIYTGRRLFRKPVEGKRFHVDTFDEFIKENEVYLVDDILHNINVLEKTERDFYVYMSLNDALSYCMQYLDDCEDSLSEIMKKYYQSYQLLSFSEVKLLLIFHEEYDLMKHLITSGMIKHKWLMFTLGIKVDLLWPLFVDNVSINLVKDNFLNYYYIAKDEYDNYIEMITEGETNMKIIRLMYDDNISEFISYITVTNFDLRKEYHFQFPSANKAITHRQCLTMTQIAASLGAFQIFKYIIDHTYRIGYNMWMFAIYGGNPEIIHYLEDNYLDFNNIDAAMCCARAFRSDFMRYFEENYSNMWKLEYEDVLPLNNYEMLFEHSDFMQKVCDENERKVVIEKCKLRGYTRLVSILEML